MTGVAGAVGELHVFERDYRIVLAPILSAVKVHHIAAGRGPDALNSSSIHSDNKPPVSGKAYRDSHFSRSLV